MSERLENDFTMPLFSATKTWPAGVTSTSIGVFSPVIAVLCSKPAGSVAAPATPGAISAARQAKTIVKTARRRAISRMDIGPPWPARRSGGIVANPVKLGGSFESQRSGESLIARD